MLIIPILLFPICLILSFFIRKNKKVFVSLLTIETLTFLMLLGLLLDNRIYVHTTYTGSVLSYMLCICIFIGYEFLWLFMPIRWYDRLLPSLILGTFLLLKQSVFLWIILCLSCIYFTYFYLKYLLTNSSSNLISIEQNQVKHKTKKKKKQ